MSAPCPTFGFVVVMDAAGLDDAGREALRRAWAGLIAARGLYCGGGGAGRLTYAVASEAGQATELDREAAREWLAARADLRAWHVGPLEDLGELV